MSALTLLHQDGRWLAFDGDRVTHLDSRPKVDRATVVITDFDGAISQVTALEGSTSHAIALIEKRLRADGLIDNESKILIHQTKTVGNGYQALFTAVPLDRWQQMFGWAEGQVDHCLLLPSVALLWHALKPGRGLVLHSGRQFVFLASLRNRIVHASALAFSESQDDLAMTVAALAERAGRDLAGDDEALETLTVEWYGALTRAPEARTTAPGRHRARVPGAFGANAHAATGESLHANTPDDDSPTQSTAAEHTPGANAGSLTFDGQFDPEYGDTDADTGAGGNDAPPTAEQLRDATRIAAPANDDSTVAHGRWTDEALLEIFSASSGTTVRLGPHAMVTDADGVQYRSGVARLAASANALIAVNPAASRLMYLAERLLPWASAASLLLALALGGLGGRWTLAAHDANTRAENLDGQIADIDRQIATLADQQALPESYPQLLKFVERAGGLQRALDPHASLAMVRDAAGSDVRILRLRLDKAAAPDGNDSLRVDGMVKHDNGDGNFEGMQVARFVERLRAAGFTATAVDPQTSGARAQSPGGSFSYRLETPQAPAATGSSVATTVTTGDAS
ncbi:MAG: hypothetical protein ACREPV_03445 [Lysobacter sp.]